MFIVHFYSIINLKYVSSLHMSNFHTALHPLVEKNHKILVKKEVQKN